MLKCGGDDCTVRRPNLMGILECRQKCGRFCYNELLEFIMHAILWKRKMMLQPLNVHHIHTHTQLQLQTSIECVQWTMHLCVVWSQPVKSRVYRQTPLWLSVCWTWLPETSKSECISRNQLHKVVTYIYKWFCCHQNNIIDANAKYHSTLDQNSFNCSKSMARLAGVMYTRPALHPFHIRPSNVRIGLSHTHTLKQLLIVPTISEWLQTDHFHWHFQVFTFLNTEILHIHSSCMLGSLWLSIGKRPTNFCTNLAHWCSNNIHWLNFLHSFRYRFLSSSFFLRFFVSAAIA